MKVLVVCRAGVVRSVALAKILRELFGHDALPISWMYNSADTIATLCGWADKIIVVEPGYLKKLPEYWQSEAEVVDIGPDQWHDASNPDLIWRIYHVLSKRKDLFNV